MSSRAEMEAACEALLFVSSDLVTKAQLLAMFDEAERDDARSAVDAVLERYRADGENRGIVLDEVAGGYRLVTRPELHGYLTQHFEAEKNSRISLAALETLAIVAYRQPVTAPEIQELRSVSSTSVLRTLLENRLVRIAGRKEVVGRPFLYRTTREFLLRFGLNRLEDLPPLEDFEELLSSEASLSEVDVESPPEIALEDREEAVLAEAARLEDDDSGREAGSDSA